ncbi:TetR/AcrR family transcriptional regulator [Cellulomonas sp. DKR-3]|uniref:TetR/AcrR family transcriptional regulator n=1 Tax=Cellulomonas fulva TaxID=2835530 RepID=A0ABS5TW97_9CELL|nr:TetR/AcrR family transcriptional regulator [Cellulomonas fulva]MBT0993439.1 TetR/AcrR family transcriptional regulator [Cellulomonas fulva]
MSSQPDSASPVASPGRPPSAARERLLRTAAALFYRDGVRAVGVDRVVAEAAVTRATFYRHFPGKDDLVVAYLRAADGAVREHAGEPPGGADEARAWLRATTRELGRTVCGAGFRGCPFINAAAEYPDPTSAVRVAVLEHRAWLEGAVRTAFARSGHPDAAGAARHWMALRDGAMVAAYLTDPQVARASLEHGVDDLLAQAPGG